jgi:hypothetical protein
MFFMRKDNTDVGGKIPEMSMSGELTQGFGGGYHVPCGAENSNEEVRSKWCGRSESVRYG